MFLFKTALKGFNETFLISQIQKVHFGRHEGKDGFDNSMGRYNTGYFDFHDENKDKPQSNEPSGS